MIVGVSGKAGSGKDAAADILVRKHGFVRIGLADPMKRFAARMWGFSDEQLWGPSQFRNAPDPRFTRESGEHLSPRYALQTLGTEWGRDCDPDMWVRYALKCASDLLASNVLSYKPELGIVYECPAEKPRGVVIPDVRFANEIAAIRNAGGLVWRVRRGHGLDGVAGEHLSETEQDGIPNDAFDDVIDNEGTLDDLAAALKGAVVHVASDLALREHAGLLARLAGK